MSKNPSNIALSFTDFLLNVNTWRYTAFGVYIIDLINSAANSQTSVTDAEYNAYIQYTAFRWNTYVQHNALTS